MMGLIIMTAKLFPQLILEKGEGLRYRMSQTNALLKYFQLFRSQKENLLTNPSFGAEDVVKEA